MISSHPTVKEAYAELDRIAARLETNRVPEGFIEIHVVDDEREPVSRSGERVPPVRPSEPAVQGLRGTVRTAQRR